MARFILLISSALLTYFACVANAENDFGLPFPVNGKDKMEFYSFDAPNCSGEPIRRGSMVIRNSCLMLPIPAKAVKPLTLFGTPWLAYVRMGWKCSVETYRSPTCSFEDSASKNSLPWAVGKCLAHADGSLIRSVKYYCIRPQDPPYHRPGTIT